MNYKILSNLTSWIFPTKETRKAYRALCKSIEEDKKIPLLTKRYNKMLVKLKNKKDKIKVLFLVSEVAKWKAQSLYNLMVDSEEFEPLIAVTLLTDAHKGKDVCRKNINEAYNFFKRNGMNVVYAYTNKHYVDLKTFNPDIVIYQQPWGLDKSQFPDEVSKYALTLYIPYYVASYTLSEFDYNQDFHKFLFRYYVLDKVLENKLKRITGRDNFIGLGAPILDNIKVDENNKNSKNYVIYAPHYSFYHPLNENPVNFGTFLDNGLQILEFAKKHPEVNWVFKPHPQLKTALTKIGENIQEINNYFDEWNKIAITCYDASYIKLFSDSQMLITDSSSFLTEYFCTGKPIIHLISENCEITPLSKKMFDSFYKAYGIEDISVFFNEIVSNKNDYLKSKRLEILRYSGLQPSNAGETIFNDIKEFIKNGALV